MLQDLAPKGLSANYAKPLNTRVTQYNRWTIVGHGARVLSMAELGAVLGAISVIGIVVVPMVLCLCHAGPDLLQMAGAWIISICLVLAASASLRKKTK